MELDEIEETELDTRRGVGRWKVVYCVSASSLGTALLLLLTAACILLGYAPTTMPRLLLMMMKTRTMVGVGSSLMGYEGWRTKGESVRASRLICLPLSLYNVGGSIMRVWLCMCVCML